VLAELPSVDCDLQHMLAERRRQLLFELDGGPIPATVDHGPDYLVNAALESTPPCDAA
jgi:hypothetical protein